MIPASALAESMVAPARHGDAALDAVGDVVERLPSGVVRLK